MRAPGFDRLLMGATRQAHFAGLRELGMACLNMSMVLDAPLVKLEFCLGGIIESLDLIYHPRQRSIREQMLDAPLVAESSTDVGMVSGKPYFLEIIRLPRCVKKQRGLEF